MQEDVIEGTTAEGQAEAPAGIPASALGQLIEAMGSRRMLLGSLFGAMAGGLPFALARSAAAAPPEVRGSVNIPVRVYTNTKGTYVLFADGSITNAEKNEPPLDPKSYAAISKFQKRSQTMNHAKGSPNVAVDIHQDESGTYVIFADGSFKQPPIGGAGARGAYVEYFYAKTKDGLIHNRSSNLIVENGGQRVRFQNPFREAPFTFALWAQGGTSSLVVAMPGEPGHISATPTEWDISSWNRRPGHPDGATDGGFFGIGLH